MHTQAFPCPFLIKSRFWNYSALKPNLLFLWYSNHLNICWRCLAVLAFQRTIIIWLDTQIVFSVAIGKHIFDPHFLIILHLIPILLQICFFRCFSHTKTSPAPCWQVYMRTNGDTGLHTWPFSQLVRSFMAPCKFFSSTWPALTLSDYITQFHFFKSRFSHAQGFLFWILCICILKQNKDNWVGSGVHTSYTVKHLPAKDSKVHNGGALFLVDFTLKTLSNLHFGKTRLERKNQGPKGREPFLHPDSPAFLRPFIQNRASSTQAICINFCVPLLYIFWLFRSVCLHIRS